MNSSFKAIFARWDSKVVTHSIAYIDVSRNFNCLITTSINDKDFNRRVSFSLLRNDL